MELEIAAVMCFVTAILHTFSVRYFQHAARRFPEGSYGENIFHLLGEVEIVFGVWAFIFLGFFVILKGTPSAVSYLQGRDFTEAVFVFVIMAICSSRPILEMSEYFISKISSLLPLSRSIALYWATLVFGPLLGSFITEPAAMTVTAFILLRTYYQKEISLKLKYATIGLLFVNTSIGGTLTPFAAPPILMVAQKWNWDLPFMLSNFGWKGVLAIVLATSVVVIQFRNELSALKNLTVLTKNSKRSPVWIMLIHLVFLAVVVASAHYMAVFVGLFMFFLGFVTVTKGYQTELKIKEALLVAFFLGGLVVLGGQQRWWLEWLLLKMGSLQMYFGAITLTAVTDNAALTYLGSQVASLSESLKYALVAGSVVGGGLTVIANAPNPVGYGILNLSFGVEGISPFKLFLGALFPTVIATVVFWFF